MLAILSAITFTQNPFIQIESIFFDKTSSIFMDRQDILDIANTAVLPISYTISCHNPFGMIHCGKCRACLYRRWMFSRTGTGDASIYKTDYQGIKNSILLITLTKKYIKSIVKYVVYKLFVSRSSHEKNVFKTISHSS
jgi:hypothetical protein